MIKKHLHTLLCISLILTLYSCEGETRTTWKLHNNSSQTVRVYPKFIFTQMAADTITIAPSTIIDIAINSQLGGQSEPRNPAENIEEMIVFNSAGDTVQKDVFLQSNWSTKSNHRSRIPSAWDHEHTFTILDSDL